MKVYIGVQEVHLDDGTVRSMVLGAKSEAEPWATVFENRKERLEKASEILKVRFDFHVREEVLDG